MKETGLVKTAKILGEAISKNSPSILTGMAVTGLISTTILAVQCTPKAILCIENAKRKKEEENGNNCTLRRREVIRAAWSCYIPVYAVGLVTIGCIIGANSINTRRNAALAGMYTITDAAFKEYKSKVLETVGKNKELKIRDEISADAVKKNPPSSNEVIVTGKGTVLCYDSLTGRYFKNDIENIRKAVNELNRDLLTDMFMSVNDLYYALDLPTVPLGDQMGWDLDKGLVEVNFSSQLTPDGEPCLVLNYSATPKFI